MAVVNAIHRPVFQTRRIKFVQIKSLGSQMATGKFFNENLLLTNHGLNALIFKMEHFIKEEKTYKAQ